MQTIRAFALCLSFLIASNVVEAQQATDYSHKYDEFSGSNWESAMARLDNFALQLQNEPKTIGTLIVYGGRRGRRGEAQSWSACLKDYLVNRRGINSHKLVMINGGYRENLTVELWETADKNHIPNPEPHVKPQDVRFKGGKIGKWRRLCSI